MAADAWLAFAPAFMLVVHRNHRRNVALFNRASWYPLAMLAAFAFRMLV